jgi:hypothetical protein
MFVNIYLVFNQFYNLLIILILKYGSANLLYLALTLMVPLGNIAFTLPIPGHTDLQVTDIVGLIIICLGLGIYRFAAKIAEAYNYRQGKPARPYEKLSGDFGIHEDEQKQQLFSHLIPVAGGDESSQKERSHHINISEADDEEIIHS